MNISLAKELKDLEEGLASKPLQSMIDAHMKLYRSYKCRYLEPLFQLCVHLMKQKKTNLVFQYGGAVGQSMLEEAQENNGVVEVPEDALDPHIYHYKFFDLLLGACANENKYEDGLTYSLAIVDRVAALGKDAVPPKQREAFQQNLSNILTFMRDRVHTTDVPTIPEMYHKTKATSQQTICFYLGQSPMTDAHGKVYGSEIAAVRLAEQMARNKGVAVFIVAQFIPFGYVKNGVHYMPIRALFNPQMLTAGVPLKGPQKSNAHFDIMIVSRYVNYFLHFDARAMADKTYIWLHDTQFMTHMGPATNPGYAGPGQEIMHEIGKNWLKNLDRTLVSKIITLSPWHRDFFVDYYGDYIRPQVIIQGNGYDEEACKKAEGLKRKRQPRKFIWVSCPYRGLRELIINFPHIRQQYDDAELHVYRDTFPELEELAKQFHAEEYIFFHGYKSNPEILEAMCTSDYWLYPTAFLETYCISALEAQRLGCIAITTHLGALQTTLANDRAIFIYGRSDTPDYWDQVFTALRKLESNPKEKERLREQGRKWALTQSWAHVSKRWMAMFDNTAKDPITTPVQVQVHEVII